MIKMEQILIINTTIIRIKSINTNSVIIKWSVSIPHISIIKMSKSHK